MADPLRRFRGGLHLDDHKGASTQEPVVPARLPARLILPLQQHIGKAAQPLVTVAERVRKGQCLARADGYISASLHAPSSGTITAIGERPIAHPSGLSAPCLVLDTDGLEEWGELPPPLPDYENLDPALIRRRVREAGIVGLGGAAFPTAVKLNPGPGARIETLIVNGAECEPYITCDYMLMRSRPERVIGGVLVLRHVLKAERAIIGIEDNKSEAIAALEKALVESGAQGVHVRPLPAVYPSGGEKQLIYLLTGREVPSHGLPAEIGVICQNVGTAAAVYAAVLEGRPLISRYLTVTGEGVRRPRVLEVLIGTPMSELIEQCGGYAEGVQGLIMGGPMMGFSLASDELPVTKGTNCILATRTAGTDPQPAMPCIRCGACADACPADLLPQQLYWHAKSKDFDKVQDYHLFDCIECGCCTAVCPSHIPLVHYFRFAKTEIGAQEREREKADLARQRYEFRQARLEREKEERAAKMRKKKEALSTSATEKESKQSVIEAALNRAKAKKTAREADENPRSRNRDA